MVLWLLPLQYIPVRNAYVWTNDYQKKIDGYKISTVIWMALKTLVSLVSPKWYETPNSSSYQNNRKKNYQRTYSKKKGLLAAFSP
jgi:hypothetical protein